MLTMKKYSEYNQINTIKIWIKEREGNVKTVRRFMACKIW